MNGHYNIRRIETILGTPIRIEGDWFGQFETEQEARQVARQMVEREAIPNVAIKFEIKYMR